VIVGGFTDGANVSIEGEMGVKSDAKNEKIKATERRAECRSAILPASLNIDRFSQFLHRYIQH